MIKLKDDGVIEIIDSEGNVMHNKGFLNIDNIEENIIAWCYKDNCWKLLRN